MSKITDPTLQTKVTDWLSQEGYALEFVAAQKLAHNRFRVWPGMYVDSASEGVLREIDVLASMDRTAEGCLVRAYQVVECKWSRDKPWVVFTSHFSRMATSACAAQAIGSNYGSSLMWAIAGNSSIRELELFSSPDRPGFNGREAFSKGNDRFYNSMKSVSELAASIVKNPRKSRNSENVIPTMCEVAFPVILVDGNLFEAYFSEDDKETKVEQAGHIRSHWRGSKHWPFHSTIDIVTLDHFDTFSKQRAEDTKALLVEMTQAHTQVLECIKTRSLKPLNLQKASRGIVGIPLILRKLIFAEREKS